MYPDDLAYLVFAIQNARDYNKISEVDFYKMPPFIYDYLMIARMFHLGLAILMVGFVFLLVKKIWKVRGVLRLVYCGVLGVLFWAAFTQIVQAYQAWAHPIDWMVKQFIQFN